MRLLPPMVAKSRYSAAAETIRRSLSSGIGDWEIWHSPLYRCRPILVGWSIARTGGNSPSFVVTAISCSSIRSMARSPHDGKPRANSRIQGPTRTAMALVRFGPDGRTLFVWGLAKSIPAYDVETGKVRYQLAHEEPCHSVRFSPDGRHVVTAAYDKRARVWDYATGEPVAKPIQHPDWVFDAYFHPDGRHLLTTCRDGPRPRLGLAVEPAGKPGIRASRRGPPRPLLHQTAAGW